MNELQILLFFHSNNHNKLFCNFKLPRHSPFRFITDFSAPKQSQNQEITIVFSSVFIKEDVRHTTH